MTEFFSDQVQYLLRFPGDLRSDPVAGNYCYFKVHGYSSFLVCCCVNSKKCAQNIIIYIINDLFSFFNLYFITAKRDRKKTVQPTPHRFHSSLSSVLCVCLLHLSDG